MSQAIVTWYGHSCFQIELAGSSVVIDPYAVSSVPGLRLPDLTADAVCVSHGHSDHNASERVLCTGRKLGFSLREVAGQHDHHSGSHRGKNAILVIEGEGLRIVHMGDQGCRLTPEQVKQIGKPDLLMIPVGGYFTVDAAEAKEIMKALEPRVTVPMHYRGRGFGFDALSTVDEFLQGDVPVMRAETEHFIITRDMPTQILIPRLVQ